MTGKQRMLNAYRGVFSDRPPIAPEFWYYYPAKVLGLDMIEFGRYPFHLALKATFEEFACEGWGAAFCGIPNAKVSWAGKQTWKDDHTLASQSTVKTPFGELTSGSQVSREEPAWVTERFIKDLDRDLPAWECMALGGDVSAMDVTPLVKAWQEVGEAYLLEAWIGGPFFDFFAEAREGGFETAIYDFLNPDFEPKLIALQAAYQEQMVAKTRFICEHTPYESLAIGCSWSCNSLIGPALWRRWDKPIIRAVADEVHRHNRLLHIHFHGRCMETVADFAEIGIDCVCPFERPPGGDVTGRTELETVARLLKGRTTMNGNVHTVETLIRGTPDDVRRETQEILDVFRGNPRVIVGTGDQVGRETPEENLRALINTVKQDSP